MSVRVRVRVSVSVSVSVSVNVSVSVRVSVSVSVKTIENTITGLLKLMIYDVFFMIFLYMYVISNFSAAVTDPIRKGGVGLARITPLELVLVLVLVC